MSRCRAELSVKNKYWIPKYRYYELKYFCLQYPEWRKRYSEVDLLASPSMNRRVSDTNNIPDIVAKKAIEKGRYANLMKQVEQAAISADSDIYQYIIKGVTEGMSYTYMEAYLRIPCSKDTYYDRYRKFFWLLDQTHE